MRHLIKRGGPKGKHKSQLERLLMRQCFMLTTFILTGLVTLTASTWALFSQKISLGTYQAEAAVWGVRISQNGEALTGDAVYLTPGPRNKFVITATGNGASGFCYVYLDGEEYVTETLESGDKLTFYVKVRGEQVYETASGSVARYQVATGSEADSEFEDEFEEDWEFTEIELMIVPQMGLSPLEDGAVALFGLEEDGFAPADIGELAYVISDGETLYCGEEEEEHVLAVKAPESGGVVAGATIGEVDSGSGQSSGNEMLSESEPPTSDSQLSGEESVLGGNAEPEEESVAGEETELEANPAEGEESAQEVAVDSGGEQESGDEISSIEESEQEVEMDSGENQVQEELSDVVESEMTDSATL